MQGLVTNEGILLDLNLRVAKDSPLQYTEKNCPGIEVFYNGKEINHSDGGAVPLRDRTHRPNEGLTH